MKTSTGLSAAGGQSSKTQTPKVFFLYSNMAVVCVSDVHCIFVPLESYED